MLGLYFCLHLSDNALEFTRIATPGTRARNDKQVGFHLSAIPNFDPFESFARPFGKSALKQVGQGLRPAIPEGRVEDAAPTGAFPIG